MFELPWYSIILISIPQTILIILLGFQLFNLQMDFRRCLIIALLLGVITYALRRSSMVTGGTSRCKHIMVVKMWEVHILLERCQAASSI